MGSTRPQVERRKDPEEILSTTLLLKLIRYVISRRATRSGDGQERKTKYIDVKTHLVPKCAQDVYVELPAEPDVKEDECGKLIY